MHIDEATALTRAALGAFGLPGDASIAFVKYRENHVFRVGDGGTSYAMRLHRPGYRTDGEIRTEIGYVRELRAAGVPVPELLTTTDGAPFARVSTLGHERVVSVQRWLNDAEPFGDAEEALTGGHTPEPDEFERIGELLGRLHVAASRIGIPAGFERAAWDADGLAGPAPLWGDPRGLRTLTPEHRALLNAVLPVLRRRLQQLGTDPDVYGVVHADTTPENILMTDDGPVLIDFDDFGTGWFVFDLVTALFHHTWHPRGAEYERALLTGYEAIRPLSAAERDAWDALDLARGFTYLGWAAEREGDPAPEFISRLMTPFVIRAANAFAEGDPAPWRTSRTPTPDRKETR